MTKDSDQPSSRGDDFEKRHQEELGVKKFAKVQAIYTLVPILAAAAGAALGYYALARPIAKLFPKASKAAGVAEVAVEKVSKSIGFFWKGESVQEAFKEFKPTGEQLEKLTHVWSVESTLGRRKQLEKSVEILNLALPEVPKTFRLGSAAGAGMVGMMGGGITIGYDVWKKEESARLAAQEINHDIANLELFKPSDPELLAENKRLSAMVAALPTVDTATVEKQGRVEEKQQVASK